MIYLASPYSHHDPVVRENRFRAACRAVTELLKAGRVVFSPIVHSHALVEYGLPIEWKFWERFDWAYMERCDEVRVLRLFGWRESRGVQEEIRIAKVLSKPVEYMDLA